MFTKNFYLILILALLPSTAWSNSPFGLGQNMKKPDFANPDKKGKKAPHKNALALKPLAELKEGLKKALEQKDYETAIKHLDALRMVCTDTEELKTILLQLADLYYTQEKWAKSEHIYQEFAMLYPGAQKCDYAHFRAVICGFKLTAELDRDQTKTQEVLKYADEFMSTHKSSAFLNEVTAIATQCREKLLASDVNVFNFYINSKNYKAAQKRLDIITKEHVPQLASAEIKTLELTIELAQAQNNTQNLLEAQFKLVSNYPESEITKNLIAQPEEIKLAWETKYNIIEVPGLPTQAPIKVAVAESVQENSLGLKEMVKDPLKPVEQSKVKVAQAKTQNKSA